MTTVSAVLVGYGGSAEALCRAVRSLQRQTLAPTQIICVDQSADGRFERLLRHREGVEIVRPECNLGYPSACNRAAAIATGEHLLFLNPDAEADADCVAELASALAACPGAVIAGAQILLCGREQVNAGDNVLHLSGLSWAGRYGLAPERGPVRAAAVVSGAALLVRREAFQELGGYTEGFFMYYDDVDLAWRAQLRGGRVLFCPLAQVVHEYEFAKGSYKWLYLERNRWWCLLAHFRSRTLLALAPLLVAVELAIWARAAAEGWMGAKLASYRALWADRRALRARRREVQSSRRVGDRAIVERMSASVESPFLASRAVRRADPALRAYRSAALALVR
ncbi:MAG: glycosyltransferase family 2 protein [Solirubrobacterales bacterium]|nr:glycosyltransferase family 2 protein [Solirubrobacterales bacterium]